MLFFFRPLEQDDLSADHGNYLRIRNGCKVVCSSFYILGGVVKNADLHKQMQEMLTPDIIEDLTRILPMQPDATSVATVEYLYAQYVINREITAQERTDFLQAIGDKYSYDLYTPDEKLSLPEYPASG